MSAARSVVREFAEASHGQFPPSSPREPLRRADASGAVDPILLPGSRAELAVARQVRAQGLVAGTQPADIAAAIARRCGSSKIRAYRLALGIALADVVAQVRARYEADGRKVPRFSETLLSAYESGQKRPGAEYLHYLCATYGADPVDLGFAGRCLCGRSHRPDPSAPSTPAASQPVSPAGGGPVGTGTSRAAVGWAAVDWPAAASPAEALGLAETTIPMPWADADEDGNELRAMLIRQMAEPGNQVDGKFLGAVDRIRGRMDEALLGRSASVAMLDRWEQSTLSYGRQYQSVPPVRLLCDVLLDFAEVRRMCEERQPLEVSEQLFRLAAEFAGLAGIAMLDLGDHRLARSFFRTARTAADETGDRQLRAWVTTRESLVPLYYGDPREAASLAGSAADLAGRHQCVAAVMAPVIRARAHARLVAAGDSGRRAALDRARSSLDRAHEALADLPADQRADTALGYTERQLYFHAGDVLVSLGDWQAAHRAFDQARQLYARSEVLDCALVSFGQARCLLAADEPDQALGRGRDVLVGLPDEHRTAVLLQVARSLGREAAGRDSRLRSLPGYREALRSA